jgi:hypothetical protein
MSMAHKVQVVINGQQEELLSRLAADGGEGKTIEAVLRHGFAEYARQYPDLVRRSAPVEASTHE